MGWLIKEGCLTVMQRTAIEAELRKRSPNEATERLLRILKRKSVAEFEKFKNCFGCSGQHHIVALLEWKAGLSINC
jgi:hypothetical protein